MKNIKPVQKFILGLVACVTVIVAVAYCVDHLGDGEGARTLSVTMRSANEADPAQDVIERVQNGDTRYIGLMGFCLYFPGLSPQESQLLDSKSYLVLYGTSDCVESRYHARLLAGVSVCLEIQF